MLEEFVGKHRNYFLSEKMTKNKFSFYNRIVDFLFSRDNNLYIYYFPLDKTSTDRVPLWVVPKKGRVIDSFESNSLCEVILLVSTSYNKPLVSGVIFKYFELARLYGNPIPHDVKKKIMQELKIECFDYTEKEKEEYRVWASLNFRRNRIGMLREYSSEELNNMAKNVRDNFSTLSLFSLYSDDKEEEIYNAAYDYLNNISIQLGLTFNELERKFANISNSMSSELLPTLEVGDK